MIAQLTDRFWSYVPNRGRPGCWSWAGAVSSNGYGHFSDGPRGQCRTISAHRFSYELHHGTIPHGMCICHRCDNRLCVNPEHLFLGTQKMNVHDCMVKGRHMHGAKHGRAKLTEEAIAAIRQSRDSYNKLAKKYNVGKSTIHRVKRHIGWRHASLAK